jgi:FKBP-type peptidyl-prolyl cis-trans isomerase SlpA
MGLLECQAMNTSSESLVVGPQAHLTLHYSIALTDTAETIISTFGERPATITVGLGQLAEPLEQRLLGLKEDDRQVFELPAGEAFGPRNPDMIQRVSMAMLKANGDPDESYEPGDLVEFPTPDGGRFAGVLKTMDEAGAVFDFNHPLAGRPIRFEVHILGIL